jgi:hypothetical protein
MIWNIFIHALIGWLGLSFFTLTPKGIFFTLVVVACTQAVDLIRIKKEKLQWFKNLPQDERESAIQDFNANMKSILGRIFLQNFLTYSFIVLIAAHASRTYNWGI